MRMDSEMIGILLSDSMHYTIVVSLEMSDEPHLFQHCTTGSVVEYQQIEETIAPKVLQMITKWINSLGF